MAAQILLFEDYELDRGAYQLRRGPLVLRMERIPLDLLFLLAERAGELVSREEILEGIWGRNVFVDADNSINTAIRKVRLALEDDQEAPRFIATVPAKGYRFIAQVRVSLAQRPVRARVLDTELRERVMLVVLPFENLSKDPDQEYFSDGLTEEVIANLGELASDRMGIIARTSAMAYK
ncbi:MAG: winged helix-turn-helix domain-containing protein, partial [Candidatus Acidiferrales bacterium]